MKKSAPQPTSSSIPLLSTLKNRNSQQQFSKPSAKPQGGVVPKRSVMGKSLPGIHGQKSSYFRRLEQRESGSSGGLSQAEAEDLAGKFAALSGSIVALAHSRDSLGLRSLEAALTREIERTLGPALNHPKFSQGFIQSTRTLLDSLVSDYESGKVSPSLIKSDGNNILEANSSTTLSYRDKYFKELVINILHTMCSSNIDEEEIDKKSVRSAESQERIQDIRNMVREELGIAPEAYAELELRITELRSMFKTTMEEGNEEGKIAESLDYLKIPRSARDALRTSCESRKGSPLSETRDVDYKEDPIDSQSYSDSGSNCTKNLSETCVLKNPEEYEGRGCENEDAYVMLKQDLDREKNMGFIRAGRKNNPINERYSSEKCIDPLESYSRKFCIESANDDENDDSINEEDTRVFLEALRADVDKINKLGISDQMSGAAGVDKKANESLNVHFDNGKINFLEVRDVDGDPPLLSKETCHVHEVNGLNKENLQLCSPCISAAEAMRQDINAQTAVSVKTSDELQPNYGIPLRASIDRVKSRFWLSEAIEEEEIVKEIQTAFDKFNLVSDDTFEKLKTVPNESKRIPERLLESTAEQQISEYSVEDFGDIVNKLSKRIRLLPITFDADNPGFLERRKTRAFGILRVLERCFRSKEPNIPIDSDHVFPLNDRVKFTQSIKCILLAFSNLAAIIDKLPAEIKNMPIYALDPPKTLIQTMTVLFSADYFRDCFTPAEKIALKDNCKLFDSVKRAYGGKITAMTINDVTHASDEEKSSTLPAGNKHLVRFEDESSKNQVTSVKPDHGTSLGYSTSNITVQNLSDTFLHISTILNDVPESFKESKLMTLNPPESLKQAVSILYCSDSAEFTPEYVKTKSLASMTVRNTADVFLTLSSIFHRAPESVKSLTVKDLDPPRSLTTAIGLITSLSNSAIQERLIRKVVPCREKEEQEYFFDALDSLDQLTL